MEKEAVKIYVNTIRKMLNKEQKIDEFIEQIFRSFKKWTHKLI